VNQAREFEAMGMKHGFKAMFEFRFS